MEKHIHNNIVSTHPTNFLMGVELIRQAMNDTGFCSENWAYPTQYRYGFADDIYYAEVWCNGMDWNNVYWLIEKSELHNPRIYPMIYFEDSYDRNKYNDYDFKNFCDAIMYYRRDIAWIKSKDPMGYYSEIVWPYICRTVPEHKLKNCSSMVRHRVEHGSQEAVEFYVNEDLIPKQEKKIELVGDACTIPGACPLGEMEQEKSI